MQHAIQDRTNIHPQWTNARRLQLRESARSVGFLDRRAARPPARSSEPQRPVPRPERSQQPRGRSRPDGSHSRRHRWRYAWWKGKPRIPRHSRGCFRRSQGGGSSEGQAQVEGLLPAGLWRWIEPRQRQVVDMGRARGKGFLLS
jgi:hypothetical protein